MQRSGISHSRLMRESTDRIESALRSDDDRECLIANRILGDANVFQRWETEHAALMRQVAACGALCDQAAALRQTSLRLIHGKALFEHLKHNEIRGATRAVLLRHFYPTRGSHAAAIAEHGAYLRKAGSYLCSYHLGADVVQDPAFLDPIQHYETLYGEYFEMYCETLLSGEDADAASPATLLSLLKHQLNEWRWLILNPRDAEPRLKRERELRRSTGDTQRLPVLRIM